MFYIKKIEYYEKFRFFRRFPWRDTRVKITDAVEDFLKKHNIKLSRKDVNDLVDDIEEVAPEA